MSGQRMVKVTFTDPTGERVVERYGPFTTTDDLVTWIDRHEEVFGPTARFLIQRLGVPDLKPVPKRRARKGATS